MRYEKMVSVVDSHTAGEQTRVIISGLPHLPGKTIMEKCDYASRNLGHVRRILRFEPRGKRGTGEGKITAITAPVSENSHFGCVWIEEDFERAISFCGHAVIGVVTTVVELGMIEPKEPVTEVRLDLPLGLATCCAHVKNGIVESVTVQPSWGAFHHESFTIDLPRHSGIGVDIGFGGRYSAFIRGEDIGVKVTLKNVPRLMEIAKEAYPLIARKVDELRIVHPDLPSITWRNHIIIEDEPMLPEATHKSGVFAPPERYFDRSPCGSGTCANMAVLYSKGELKIGEEFVNENLMGTATFIGKLTSRARVGNYDAVIPQYRGSAHITAIVGSVVDPRDPFRHGFDELEDMELARILDHSW